MPGVPSGRACDACRAQKKKCNQAKPSCSRCSRLQITCVGSGQQRYTFKHQRGLLVLSSNRHDRFEVAQISPPPSNAQTVLAGGLVDKLKASTDLRYHLSWTYGGYLEDIPQRLGRSEALDAAVDALVCAHSNFAGPGREVSPMSLRKYSDAIATLRVCLNDANQASSADTLCAVTLLMICHGFLVGGDGLYASHCKGAAEILKVRGYYDEKDEFERKLLLALRGSVLFQALLSDSICLSSWEWKLIVENELDGNSYEGQMMRCLARVPDLMQRGRVAFGGPATISELWEESKSVYDVMKVVLEHMRDRFMIQPRKGGFSLVAPSKLHCHFQRTYGLALAVSIILNCVLRAIDPENVTLGIEAAQWSEEIIALAKAATIYRPIAASYMIICLIAAWGGSTNEAIKRKAIAELRDYIQDFSYGKEVVVSTAELDSVFCRFRLKGVRQPTRKEDVFQKTAWR